VEPRAGLDAALKKKVTTRCRESNPYRPTRSAVSILTKPE